MEQDDLTASHWDDVITPGSVSIFGNLNSSTIHTPNNLNNEFNDLHIGRDAEEEDEDEEEEVQASRYDDEDHPVNDQSVDHIKQAELEQLNELKKEERNEHKNSLLSELTNGADAEDLLLASSSIVTPKKVNPSESLFNVKDSPIKFEPTPKTNEGKGKKTLNTKNSQAYRANPRSRKHSSKSIIKHLDARKLNKEEIVPANSNPLGPLDSEDGRSNDLSSIKSNNKAEQLVQEANAPLYELPKNDQPELTNPPVLVERAKPNEPEETNHAANRLDIIVSDPMKVGDITTAHIVYNIKTRNKNTSPESLPVTPEPITVARRYKDFRWIYHQLQNNHPGRIIPPPPTKQTYIGRFNENFIENRRLSLEKMLSKISNVPVLSNDPDFVMFLISEDFANESRERERQSGSAASLQNNDSLDNDKDDDSSLSGSTSSNMSAPIISGGGFMTSLFSISTKVSEPDDYFIEKKQYIDELEHNLRNFYRAIELIGTQRMDLIGILDEISLALDELAELEILKTTSELLSAFSEVQLKLKENLDRINLQDQLTLGFTIEEYLRIIGSIKFVFETRTKVYQQYHTFNQDLIKKQAQLDKQTRKYKMQVDKNNLLAFEVDKLKQKTAVYEKQFNTISDTIKSEVANFEFGKIEDFRNSVEIFIESSIESQKEAIELYETFYERQNLASV
ncbi:Vps5-domain-containing protein [Suhomyces tanzawaensis NRRL Y-17324]|uniref:Vps5-domain-containing protein n=1 Tax=Suhomyces tanzawaensis NRRL Y-17324 TaxID=984487 RepID=A0A1E4SF50_9ASCO|nr:Vps5-domain-containing protein [Suhomyces tanzawaensis NRRL Y-17324]ODV78022.1 Vps5-domain-containing protein [Suhomyces tanzawaensis NRRL Y-17324]